MLRFLALVICQTSLAQDISFFHLSKKDGLSDNQVTAVVTDKNGMLWVGTNEGLNSYDGFTVNRFYKEDHPELQNNNILRMVCDNKNRIWIHFADKSIKMLDENRKFHSVVVKEGNKPIPVDYLLPYTSRGVLFLTGSKLFAPDSINPLTTYKVKWKEDTLMAQHFVRINTWDKDKLVCSGADRFCIFDVTNLKVLYPATIPGILAAVKLNDHEALVTITGNNKLSRLNLRQGKITESYENLKDQYGEPMMAYPRSIYHLENHKYIFTSAYAGVYTFDAFSKKLWRHKHNPVDPQSISANNTSFIFSNTTGYFFITSNSTGLSYFNTRNYLANTRSFFVDNKSKLVFDGYINCIAEDKDGFIWLGTQNNLIKWDPITNRSVFIKYGTPDEKMLSGKEEVRAICVDSKNRLWIGLNRYGLLLYDHKYKFLKHFSNSDNSTPLFSNLVNNIQEAPDGKIWVSTGRGVNVIDEKNLNILTSNESIAPGKLHGIFCNGIWFDSLKNKVWIGSNIGAFKVDMESGAYQRFNTKNGLLHDIVISVAGDRFGDVYIGTDAGLNIIKDTKITASYSRNNGLRANRCDGVQMDNEGNIWIGNDNSLFCYDPLTKKLTAFDESSGLGNAGFRGLAFLLSKKGEIFWGSEQGVSWFSPDKLINSRRPLHLTIKSVTTPDSIYRFTGSANISLPYQRNSVLFSFSAIDLYSSKNIRYRYMLEGADKTWLETSNLRLVQYSNLSPGDYTFLLQASRDGMNWTVSQNNLHMKVATPWWQSGWYIFSFVAVIIGTVVFINYQRSKKLRVREEELETEKAINYFASSMYEQHTVEDILWDVAKNCISHLHFEDCVIYLVDENRNMLIQKAAWGPKTTQDNKIINPLEIPVGNGISGNVAATGIAEIVNDTSSDKRYIVDDIKRLSEIAIPIIYNEKVLGIIDSENSKKNYFTKKHLSILTTIASLCANKIIRVRAENEKQQVQLTLLEKERSTAEAQLKSLRLQMNPHFLFNSLNSIQQMIMAGEEASATLYLSKFSRLLRLILSHSDKEKVTLKEEIETLNLYAALESLRFNDTFHYQISCDESVDTEETKIPTLLIQPFVENAIWHGLLHKEGDRILTVKFTEDKACNLVCIVEDNGVGRKASLKVNGEKDHTSKGISVAKDRLTAYNKHRQQKSDLRIDDLTDEEGVATGTRVTVTLPLLT